MHAVGDADIETRGTMPGAFEGDGAADVCLREQPLPLSVSREDEDPELWINGAAHRAVD